MPVRRSMREPGRPKGRSGLPAPIPGQPFSLLATLKRTTRPLTAEDCAYLLNKSLNTVYRLMDSGKLPCPDYGFNNRAVDPKAWYEMLAKKNPHLIPSAKAALQEAA